MIAIEWTDADAYRVHHGNDRICDFARRDYDAGRHKHWLDHVEGSPGMIVCSACGRYWEDTRPEEQE